MGSGQVIELKPDNRAAIRKGQIQARSYAADLNKLKDDFKRLVSKDADFKDCKEFEEQVDCYTLCPDIDSDGQFKSTSVSWRTDC